MKLKKLLCSFFIIFIMCCTFVIGYSQVQSFDVYADSTLDGWTNVTSVDQMADAFRYYCKSRNVTLSSGAAAALTKFTTSTFNNLCNALGINITGLQAELKYRSDGNAGLRYYFTATGISAYNRIFAEFLQNNNLSVGDSVNNKELYSGSLFTDADGYTALVYIVNSQDYEIVDNEIEEKGDYYKYSKEQLKVNNGTFIYNLTSSDSLTLNTYYNTSGNDEWYKFDDNLAPTASSEIRTLIYFRGNNIVLREGNKCIYYNKANSKLYFGHILYVYDSSGAYLGLHGCMQHEIINGSNENTQVLMNTGGDTINNNTYNNTTIIYNNGDTDDDDDPDHGGSGGGSGGGGSGGDTNVDINFPDFNFQIPNINWSLSGLTQKFPFSTPKPRIILTVEYDPYSFLQA